MPRIAAAFALALAALAAPARADGPTPAKPPALPSTEEAQSAHLAQARWTAPKHPEIPAGVTTSGIAVDPATGASVGYAKFPAGYVFPTHFHSHAEYSTLLAGKATFTLDGKAHDLLPGSYIVIPARLPHKLVCAAGAECLVLTRRAGPTDYTFVKP